ncbi:MAG: hypothetical protein NT040_17880 [Bacteroidetes bacterium]|nr:hypothetical protein [Bacteroidota bacterium]
MIKSTDKNITGMLNTTTGIGFVSDESFTGLKNQQKWTMVLGRDVIVPVMNVKNPFLDELNRKGITQEGLTRIFNNPENQSWGTLLGNGQNIPLHCFMTDDASVKSGVGNFLHSQVHSDGTVSGSREQMIAAIQQDPNAVGFCRLADIIDYDNQALIKDIRLIPIDKNGNGKIDFMEDIYGNLQEFTRGIWIGKYPKALSVNIYSVSSARPENESEVAFLKWVLTDGQQLLGTNGFSDLVNNERQTQLDKLNGNVIQATAPENDAYTIFKVVILVLIAFGLLGFILDVMSRELRKNKKVSKDVAYSHPAVFDENSMNIPKGIYFDKTHTWAFMEKDGSVKIGIDEFLQHVTGPLTRIEMKNAGEKIKKGDRLLTLIQKGKQLIIYAPVSGTITAQNKSLISNLSALNAAPYSDGWVYMIEPTNWLREIQFLAMAEKYKTWLKDEFSRLKDFLAAVTMVNTPQYAHIALQDGGSLKDCILADLGPEIWEDFQTKFIDGTR